MTILRTDRVRVSLARGVAATATVIALAITGILAGGVSAVADPTGSITGSVVIPAFDGDRAAIADEVAITVWEYDPDAVALVNVGQVETLADGTFASPSLEPGQYLLEYSYRGGDEPNIFDQFSNYTTSPGAAIFDGNTNFSFIEVADAPVAAGSFLMSNGARLEGSLYSAATVTALSNQTVTLWRQVLTATGSTVWEEFASDVTDPAGYLFTGLDTGTYTLRFNGGSGYVGLWWNNSDYRSVTEASTISLTAPNFYTNPAAYLLAGSTVRGSVKTASGVGIGGIDVSVYDYYSTGSPAIATTTTASNGSYTIANLPADTYSLGFASDPVATVQYRSEFYNDKFDRTDADSIDLATGATLTRNAVLGRASTISGVVTAALGGAPVSSSDFVVDACVWLIGLETFDCGKGNYTPLSGGAFVVSDLLGGSYTLHLRYTGSQNLQDEYFGNVYSRDTATKFTVGLGTNVTGKNFALDAGSTISGTVTIDSVGSSGFSILAERTDDLVVRSATTDASGNYTIRGLSEGSYTVLASAGTSGIDVGNQYFPAALSKDQGDLISFSTATDRTAINFALQHSHVISGTVTDALGDPVTSAYVCISKAFAVGTVQQESGSCPRQVYTDENGHYSASGMASGSYRVDVYKSGFASQYYGGAPGSNDGNVPPLVVTDSDVTADIVMHTSPSITGHIVDSNGDPIAGAQLNGESVWDVTSDENGDFASDTGIDLTEITVRAEGYATTTVDLPALSFDSPAVDLGTIALADESIIRGKVIGINGKGVADQYVYPFTLDDKKVPHMLPSFTRTSASGNFEIRGLAAGDIYIQFYLEYPNHPQYLGGGANIAQSTPIHISGPGETIYREVRATRLGSIAGTVMYAGKPAKGVRVTFVPTTPNIDPSEEDWNWWYTTSSTGTYSIQGLPAGTYTATYNDYNNSALDPTMASTSKIIYVPAGTTVKSNVTLGPIMKVSGVVRDQDGAPLGGVEVQAHQWDSATETTHRVKNFYSRATTASNGAYTIYLDPATYVIQFTDPTFNRVGARYLGGGYSPSDTDTTKLTLTAANKTLTGKDVTLHETGTIGGEFVAWNGSHKPCGTATLIRFQGATTIESRAINPAGYFASECERLKNSLPLRDLADGTYRLKVDSIEYDAYWSIPDFQLDFTVGGGVLTEVNGAPPTDPTSFGTITLPAPVAGTGRPELDPLGASPSITIVDALTVGGTLHANQGDWTLDPTDKIWYQWRRDGRTIAFANAEDYVLAPGDAGKHISFAMYMSRTSPFGGKYLESVYVSDPTGLVSVASGPLASSAPTISGTAKVGSILTASHGEWSANAHTFRFTWTRTVGVETTIVGTASTYKLTAADYAADSVTLTETGVRVGYETVTSSVNVGEIALGTAPIATTKPKSSLVGANYTFVSGVFSPSGTAQHYVWRIYDPATDAATTVHADEPLPQSETTGKRSELVVTASKSGYADATVTIAVTSGPQVTVAGEPVVVGTPRPGIPLTADVSGLVTTPSGATFAYSWTRNGVAISGAKATSYTPTPSDVGAQIRVSVTASKTGYPTSAAIISLPRTVEPPASFSTTSPVITGTVAVGRKLSSSFAQWTPAAATTTYQWYRVVADVESKITGATTPSYTVLASDLGKSLRLKVTGARIGYVTTTVSTTTAPVITAPIANVTAPSIGTSAGVGTKVTATTGTWDVAGATYAYRWYLNGVLIIGATSSSYTPTVGDYDEELSVAVIASKTGFGSSVETESAPVTVTLGAAVKPSSVPKLSVAGLIVTSVSKGKTLNASAGTWPVSALSITYQWQVNRGAGFVNLDGATLPSLFMDGGDPSNFTSTWSYRVAVSATKTGYVDSVPVTSAAVKLK